METMPVAIMVETHPAITFALHLRSDLRSPPRSEGAGSGVPIRSGRKDGPGPSKLRP